VIKARAKFSIFALALMVGVVFFYLASNKPANATNSTNTVLKWSTQAAAGNGTWTAVAWSPELGKFVAVAKSSSFPIGTVQRIMSSPDAKTWTLVSGLNISATAGVFTSVTWSPEVSLFVAVACGRTTFSTCGDNGTNLRVMTSPDGTVWTERATPDTNSTWQSIVWSPELDLFVAVADGGTSSVMTSPNGINWTARSVPEDNTWKSVAWSPELNLFVAVAGSGTNRVMTSSDGINWIARAAAEANTWVSLAWSPQLGTFVAVSSDGTNRVMTSSNGINWTARAASAANVWSSVAWSPSLQKFAAVANSGTNRIMTSPDGVNWTAGAASVDNSWNAITWSPQLGTFAAVGSGGTTNSGPPFTSARVMTGSLATSGTNAATTIGDREATLNGDYLDDFPNTNVFFAGSTVFFRYRVAGSADPFTDTTPQAVATEGAFNVNLASLTPDTEYEFKAVVQWPSASGAQTLEGGLLTFVTLPADDDNDGAPNATENAAPNSGDANDDGTLDSTQANIASYINPITNTYAVLTVDTTCAINAASSAAESSNLVVDSGFDYPAGLMGFTVNCGTPGYTTSVTQYYFGVTNDNFVLRKYKPNMTAYFNVNGATLSQVTIGGQMATKVVYQATDGGDLDIDGTANGTIVDPVGLAQSVVDVPNTGLGGRR
jgi:hypothetical protein